MSAPCRPCLTKLNDPNRPPKTGCLRARIQAVLERGSGPLRPRLLALQPPLSSFAFQFLPFAFLHIPSPSGGLCKTLVWRVINLRDPLSLSLLSSGRNRQWHGGAVAGGWVERRGKRPDDVILPHDVPGDNEAD